MTNPIHSLMKPNEQKISFQRIARIFFGYDCILNEMLIFFEVLLFFLESSCIKLLPESAIGFMMSIKRTYLEPWADS